MAQLPPLTAIYQLRLVLAGISPIIWRRLLVSSESTIAQLHQYIQACFDWRGEHLHRFRIHGKDYGIAYLGGIRFDDNPYAVPLSRFRLHRRESFRYEYDEPWRICNGWTATATSFRSKRSVRWPRRSGAGWMRAEANKRSVIWGNSGRRLSGCRSIRNFN